jgi:hypothetical protein
MKWDRAMAPAAVHAPLGIPHHPKEKANAKADSLENQFTSHDLCDENYGRYVEVRVQAIDDIP